MADTRVLPVSSIKYGLKAETSFGVGIDTSSNDGTAYLTQPAVQVQKHTVTSRGPWPKDKPVKEVRRGDFDDYTYIVKGILHEIVENYL